jgi:HSP20 family protein
LSFERRDQVELEVDPDNVLHITTAKRDTREDRGEEGGWRYHRQERYAASSSRSVQLPRNVDASGISARVDNGVLRVLIPKLREQASSRKRITVA